MTVTPTIYTWPSLIVPINQLFHSGGEASEAVFTVGGVLMESPEVGGRAFLEMTFNYMRDDNAGRQASWLFSKLNNRSVFRIPIWRSIQLCTPAGVTIATESQGVPWDNGQPWSNGQNWAYEPVGIAGAALEGAVTFTLDMGALGAILAIGHVIGPASGGAHLVENIEYDGTMATVTVTPPLRKDVDAGDAFTLRPTMFATADNPESFRSSFEYGKWVRPGSLTMMEAIV